MRAEAVGFARQDLNDVVLVLGSSVELLVTMQVLGISGQVDVNGTALVDMRKTEISNAVLQQQIVNLPINGRNFVAFALITPGISTDRTPAQGPTATSGLTFAGQSARANNIMVDGVDNTEAALGSVRGTFSQEAVREFQVLTNSFSAEFGKATGGIVNILTRSGTNSFAGSAFLYYRDDVLNAKSYFERFNPAGQRIDTPKAAFDQKQFGATFGGPVRKNRTFFFTSFERLKIDANNFVNIDNQTVVANPNGGAPLGTPADILRAAGFQFDLGNVPYAVRGNQFLLKVDHQFSNRQSSALRFNYADFFDENSEPFGGITAKSNAGALNSDDYALVASHTAFVSSSLFNETRFQYAFREQNFLSLDPACGGPCLDETQGGPTIEVAGIGNLGRQRAAPQPRSAGRYQLLDTVTFIKDSHQLKLGFDFSFIANKSSIPLLFGGRYIFAALPAIPGVRPALSPIQAVALGLPSLYIQGYGNSRGDYDYKDISAFALDDWSLTPHLTLKLGVRYQRQIWDMVAFHEPVIGSYTFPSDNNNLAPRLAIAWSPGRKAVVHAGYGVFYGNHITAVSSPVKVFNGATGARTLVLRGQDAAVAWNAPGHKLPEPAAPFPTLRLIIDPALGGPYTHQASVGIDRELPGKIVLSGSFIHVRGRNVIASIDYNPLVPELGPGRRPYDINGRPGTSASIIQFSSYGRSKYSGVILTATKQFSSRYQFLASYTLSKARDNTVDFQILFLPHFNGRGRDPQNPEGLPAAFDPNLDYGPSQQDQRHRFVFSGIVVAPWKIQLSTTTTVASGRPYNVLAGFDFNQDGDATNDRARGNPIAPPNDYTTTVGRNIGVMPHQAIFDLRASRRFILRERVTLEAVFEVFNLFNRINFTEINNVFGRGAYPSNPLPTFGQFTQTSAPRQAQLAAKLSF